MMCLAVSAEDIIVLRSAKRISANIIEVGKTEVKYKEANNPDGPTFILDTDDILSIIYASGTVQNFQQRPKEVSQWEYEEMQEAKRLEALKARADSIAQAKQLAKELKQQHRDSLKTDRKERWAAYPWTNMLLANGTFNSAKTFGFGLTYARVKQFGFYISATSGTNFRFKDDFADNKNVHFTPYYTGKYELTTFACTAGALFRMKAPVYFYCGLGYSYLAFYDELTGTGYWLERNGKHGVSSEVGFVGNIKGFGISIGLQEVTNLNENILIGKIGLGYCF